MINRKFIRLPLFIFFLPLISTQAISYQSALQNNLEIKADYQYQPKRTNRLLNPDKNKHEQQFISVFNLNLSYNDSYFLESELVGKIDNIIDGNYDDSEKEVTFKNRQVYGKWDIGDYQLSLGRQRFDSGVSYFYQPLRLNRKSRNPFKIQAETGIWNIQLQQYADNGSHQLTLFQPEQSTTYRQTFKQQDWAIDYLFKFFGNQWDGYFRTQANQDNKQLSFAFSQIVNDHLEIHSSHRFYEGGWKFSLKKPNDNLRPLTAEQGIQIEEQQEVSQQHLLGINFTINPQGGEDGKGDKQFNLISEYIHNENAPDDLFWSELNQLLDSHGKFGIPKDTLTILAHDSKYRDSLFNRFTFQNRFAEKIIETSLNWRIAKTHQSYEHFVALKISYEKETLSILQQTLFPNKISFRAGYHLDEADDSFHNIIPNQATYQFQMQWNR
jgi:hypothetical protein